jgi:L,D-peptidoglycan transpeptidase YkuD (ErfK/YbiS/YcfS/YnhG family)
VFHLRRAFGYAQTVETGLNYTPVSQEDFWIDDPASPQYNQWVRGEKPAVSHEVLKRADDLYKLAVVIEYNTELVEKDKGSAIFFHVWRASDQPTAGCVAMAEEEIKMLMAWLKVNQHPVAVLTVK